MKYECPSCGYQYDDQLESCPICGMKLSYENGKQKAYDSYENAFKTSSTTSEKKKSSLGLSITALILAIVTIIFDSFGSLTILAPIPNYIAQILNIIAAAIGVTAFILGIIGFKDKANKFRIPGLVLGIIAFVTAITSFITAVSLTAIIDFFRAISHGGY